MSLLIEGFERHVNPSKVIFCQRVMESCSLYAYTFVLLLLKTFWGHSYMISVFLSNSNNLYTVVWLRLFLSNTNKYYKPEDDGQLVPLKQVELSVLAWNLNHSKESSQLLGSCLKEKHLLTPGTTFYWYPDRHGKLNEFFALRGKSSLVCCNNIAGLIKSVGLEYDPTEWRLFIDLWSLLGIQYK